jgi:hypothetical protein
MEAKILFRKDLRMEMTFCGCTISEYFIKITFVYMYNQVFYISCLFIFLYVNFIICVVFIRKYLQYIYIKFN